MVPAPQASGPGILSSTSAPSAPRVTPGPGGRDPGAAYASCALSVLDMSMSGGGGGGVASASAALSSCFASLRSAGITGGETYTLDPIGGIPRGGSGSGSAPAPTGSPGSGSGSGTGSGSGPAMPSATAPSSSGAAATGSGAGSASAPASTSTGAGSSNAGAANARPPFHARAQQLKARQSAQQQRLFNRLGPLPILLVTLALAGGIVWFMDELLEMLV